MRKHIGSLVIAGVAVVVALGLARSQTSNRPTITAEAIAKFLGVVMNTDQKAKVDAASQQHHDAVAKANRDFVDQVKTLLSLTDAQTAKLTQGVDHLTGMMGPMPTQGHAGGHGDHGSQETQGGHEGHTGH